MKSYRQIYISNYGKIPDCYEIHHIDYNHNNNDPNNLVALPKSLHEQLHIYHDLYEKNKKDFSLNDLKLHDGNLCSYTLFIQSLQDYVNVIEECTIFMNRRGAING